ncbi:MAG: HAD-IA family hydrolase [Gemmatimonadetes bacterium]|nr:HAD-IA family hydrolase [Gemmatimonadota bacterium]
MKGEGANGDGWAGVLFDLDGTLADSVPLILACYRHTMTVHRGAPPPDELWLRTIGRPLRDSLADFAASAAERDAMLETYVSHQRQIHDGTVKALVDAMEVVDALRDRGVRVGVVTSKGIEMARRTLASCRMEDRFEVLVTPEDVARGKPDPEPVHVALARLGLEEDRLRVLFVGDSPFDVQAGNAAGVRTAAVPSGPFSRETLAAAGPHHMLERLRQVLELRP